MRNARQIRSAAFIGIRESIASSSRSPTCLTTSQSTATAPAPAKTSCRAVLHAVQDPFAPFPADDIMRSTGLRAIERVVATPSDIEAIIKNFYELGSSLKTAEKQLSAQWLPALNLGNQEYLSSEDQELDPAAAPVVKALDNLLSYAFERLWHMTALSDWSTSPVRLRITALDLAPRRSSPYLGRSKSPRRLA